MTEERDETQEPQEEPLADPFASAMTEGDADDGSTGVSDVDQALDNVASAAVDFASATVQPVAFGPLAGSGISDDGDGEKRNLNLLMDVSIPISVEVGCSQMSLDKILNLGPGSIVPLDKKAEEPVDLRVNGKLVAQGEVVLIDDTYGLRITQIVEPSGRLESLR